MLNSSNGLRTVALFEGAKGLLVLLAGLGALELLHHNAQPAAEELVQHLRFNPASRYPRIFIQLAQQLTDSQLWLLGTGARSTQTSETTAGSSETFVSPPEIVSSNGVLSAMLTAGTATVKIENSNVLARVYNGLYMPPTLRVRPGDKIRLRLVNALNDPTNLHYHGLNVSPLGRSDNIFIHVRNSEVFDYEIAIPENHASGLYWYHSHQHALSESQVGGGMSGGLIVDGILDPFPELKTVKERVMLLKDSQIDGIAISKSVDHSKCVRRNAHVSHPPGRFPGYRGERTTGAVRRRAG